jgi:hypothetical protein
VRSIFSQYRRPSLDFGPDSRLERLDIVSTEHHKEALQFLSGFDPETFDTVLDAVEPCEENNGSGAERDSEPFCTVCGELAGFFEASADTWQHYRSARPGGPFEVFDPGHAPEIGWCPATDIATIW